MDLDFLLVFDHKLKVRLNLWLVRFEFEQDCLAGLAKEGEGGVDVEAAQGEGDEVEACLHWGEGEAGVSVEEEEVLGGRQQRSQQRPIIVNNQKESLFEIQVVWWLWKTRFSDLDLCLIWIDHEDSGSGLWTFLIWVFKWVTVNHLSHSWHWSRRWRCIASLCLLSYSFVLNSFPQSWHLFDFSCSPCMFCLCLSKSFTFWPHTLQSLTLIWTVLSWCLVTNVFWHGRQVTFSGDWPSGKHLVLCRKMFETEAPQLTQRTLCFCTLQTRECRLVVSFDMQVQKFFAQKHLIAKSTLQGSLWHRNLRIVCIQVGIFSLAWTTKAWLSLVSPSPGVRFSFNSGIFYIIKIKFVTLVFVTICSPCTCFSLFWWFWQTNEGYGTALAC